MPMLAQNEQVLSASADQKVEELLIEAHNAQQNEEQAVEAHVYNQIAYLYWEADEAKQAEHYFLKSKSINELVGNLNALQSIYTSLGLVSIDLTQYQKAVFYFQKSSQISKETGDVRKLSDVLMNLSHAYKLLEDYENAIAAVEEVVAISKENSDYRMLRAAYGRLGDLYKATGNSEKAFEYVELYTSFKSEELKEQKKQLDKASRELTEVRQEMSVVKSKITNKEEELVVVKEDVQRMEQVTKEKQMEIDLLLKDKIIQDLKIREQEAQLHFERTLRFILIAGLLLIAGFAITIYILYIKIKEKDRELKESSRIFVELFNQAYDAFVLLKEDRIVKSNKAFLRFSNYPKIEDVIGRKLVDTFSFVDFEGKSADVEKAIVRAMQVGKSSVDLEVKEGERYAFFRLMFNTFKIGKDKTVFVFFNDLSKEKKMQTELQSSKNNLQELVLEKTYELEDVKLDAYEKERINSLILSNLGVELRSPLNAIFGVSKILKESDGVDERMKEALKVMIESAELIQSAVVEWFDVSDESESRDKLNCMDVDSKVFVSSVDKQLKEKVSSSFLIYFDLSDRMPAYIKCDVRVKQVYWRIFKFLAPRVEKQTVRVSISGVKGKVFSMFSVEGEVVLPESLVDVNEKGESFSPELHVLFLPVFSILKQHGGALKSDIVDGKTHVSFFFVDGNYLT